MLLTRLFRSLNRVTEPREAPVAGPFSARERTSGKGLRLHVPTRRQQVGGVISAGLRGSSLGMYSGIIPKTGVFIP